MHRQDSSRAGLARRVIVASQCVLLICCMLPTLSAYAQSTDDRWEADITRFEHADRADPPKPAAALFIGSSSIRFWESLAADFPQTRVIRRGFGGSAIRDSTRYASRIIVPYRPRLIVLYAGDNDLAEGRTPSEVRDDFAAFVARVRSDLPDVAIAWIAIKPSPARAAQLDAAKTTNAAIAAFASTQARVRVIDVFTPMLDADGKPRAELFGPDALHMNRAGYAIWIERIAPVLREFAG